MRYSLFFLVPFFTLLQPQINKASQFYLLLLFIKYLQIELFYIPTTL
jgi:hypothetical protein